MSAGPSHNGAAADGDRESGEPPGRAVKDAIRRLVIFRPGALGDTLTGVPALRALRLRYPSARVEYIAERHVASTVVSSRAALSLVPDVTRVHDYEPGGSWRDRLRSLRRSVEPTGRDLLVYLCYQRESVAAVLRDGVFFRLLGFRRTLGFREQLRDAWRGDDRDLDEKEHQRLLRACGETDAVGGFSAHEMIAADHAWAEDLWSRHGLERALVATVCPGTKMQSKRWPPSRYEEVLRRLSREVDDIAFVLIGGESDRALTSRLCRAIGARTIDATGCRLVETSAILARSALYIGNDTGPMHLAALHGVPCVSLFSDRVEGRRWEPIGSGHEVLRASAPCAGCRLEECYAEPSACLDRISVDDVYGAVMRVLDRVRRGGGPEPRSGASRREEVPRWS